jgi:hypothetical protein
MVELLIQSGNAIYAPSVEEGITWSTERKGSPGQLQFKVLADNALNFTEGDAVRLRYNGSNVFYGFVFKKKRDKNNVITVTAYDQLRYLKNKDTYVYENKTASQLIQMIAGDFNLQTGVLESTGYNIESRIEENTSLFDMIQNALDVTLENTKKLYVLYDDFGKITLRGLGSMKVNVLIDAETAEDFDYESSIDGNTYNKVKLTYDNEDTGSREVYIAQDSNNMNQWGVLQYFDTLKKDENGKAKANALLYLYNSKTRTLSVKNAFGDVSVRAGSLIPVMLHLGDVTVNSYMLVEKCKHEFKDGVHLMTLTLRGGEFIA